MKIRHHFAISALLPLLLASFCSGCERSREVPSQGRDVKSGSGPHLSGASTNETVARRLCDALQGLPARRKAECCATPEQRPLFEECVRTVRAALDSKAIRVAAGGLEQCERDMQRALAGCAWVTPGQPLAVESCQAVVSGEIPLGKSCRSSLECQAPLHCEGVTPSSAGVCAAPGAVGASCGVHVDTLATYVQSRRLNSEHPFCAEFCALTSHKCEPLPALGAACRVSVNCAPGQTCVSGRCSARAAGLRGESCSEAPCASGLRCRDSLCVELAGPGAACDNDFDCAAGGCVTAPDGARRCGMKCAPSFDALHASNAPALRLPLKPRAAK